LLAKLRDVAKALNLIEEFKLFEQAAQRVQPSYVDLMENQMASLRSSKAKPRCTPTEWRLMQIARLAARCYPEQARAIEQAAGPLAAFVDDFLGEAARAGIEPDESSFDDLERRLVTMAEQRVFEKKGTK
jgi:hypothetical protein